MPIIAYYGLKCLQLYKLTVKNIKIGILVLYVVEKVTLMVILFSRGADNTVNKYFEIRRKFNQPFFIGLRRSLYKGKMQRFNIKLLSDQFLDQMLK